MKTSLHLHSNQPAEQWLHDDAKVHGGITDIKRYVQQLWERFLLTFTDNSEPRVWQIRDRNDQVWWNAYDPVSGSTLAYASEAEVRIWLEQRYYN
jgi:hypothetical protein